MRQLLMAAVVDESGGSLFDGEKQSGRREMATALSEGGEREPMASSSWRRQHGRHNGGCWLMQGSWR
jgi:hypothetical protein